MEPDRSQKGADGGLQSAKMQAEARPEQGCDPLKLVYVVNARLPTRKAYGRQIMEMCDAFAGLGCEVEVIYPSRRQRKGLRGVTNLCEYYDLEHEITTTCIPTPDFALIEGAVPVPLYRVLYHVQSLWFATGTLLHCTMRRLPFCLTRELWVAYLLSIFGKAVICEMHDRPSGFRQRLIRHLVPRLKGIVTNTENLALFLVGMGIPAEHVHPLPNGVNLKRFALGLDVHKGRERLGLPLDRQIVLYSGRFETLQQEKGISTMIHCLRLLPADVIMLFIGGPEEMIGEYLDFARSVGVTGERLLFVGHVSPSLVPIYLKAADVLAIPFPWTEHFAYFASPIKLFEYMASGRPIVATDLPAIREILRDGDNAILVPPGDAEALAQGILRVLQEPGLAARLAGQAFLDVQEHTWSKRAERILAIFKQDVRDSMPEIEAIIDYGCRN